MNWTDSDLNRSIRRATVSEGRDRTRMGHPCRYVALLPVLIIIMCCHCQPLNLCIKLSGDGDIAPFVTITVILMEVAVVTF
ncbi:hypothetical protein X798_01313 [Onchocerca flexuosa]|nr:hypothetical protein X798_01313 [Onchocerca flexuosa]